MSSIIELLAESKAYHHAHKHGLITGKMMKDSDKLYKALCATCLTDQIEEYNKTHSTTPIVVSKVVPGATEEKEE